MQTFSAAQAIAGTMTRMAGLAGTAGASANALPNSLGLDANDANVASGAGVGGAETPFADLLKKAVTGVQSLENQAAGEVQGLMTGQGVDIHDAMIAAEKADLSFETALAVRSKAVSAYQAMMQMQF